MTAKKSERWIARDRARLRTLEILAAELRTYGRIHGIESRRQLARAVGMSFNQVDKILKLRGDPPLTTFLQLAQGLGYSSLDDLLDQTEPGLLIELRRAADG